MKRNDLNGNYPTTIKERSVTFIRVIRTCLFASIVWMATIVPTQANDVSFIQGEKLRQLCKSDDPSRIWMLMGYLAGVLDKAYMDEVLSEVVTKANNVHPETTTILVASVTGYCPSGKFSLADARRAVCSYMDIKSGNKFNIGPEWIQAALKRAYPCTK